MHLTIASYNDTNVSSREVKKETPQSFALVDQRTYLKVRPQYAARQNATHCSLAAWQKLLGICRQCERVHMKKEFFADLLQVTNGGTRSANLV